MPDYRHDLQFGVFITPQAVQADAVLELARLADVVGLDTVSFQDHPYQAKFLDAWTLLSVVAAETTNVRVAPNVANLPLRPPAVLARAAASLSILSSGRVDLGLGAGAFWDGIVAMGGPRLTPGESVGALDSAIDVIRATWAEGPPAPRPIEIWVGAYKPRMLRLTGAKADGWVPSLGYLELEQLPECNARIDAAAAEAGRAPEAIRRLFNVNRTFGSGSGFLEGSPEQWAQQLTDLTLSTGMSAYILSVRDPDDVRRFAEEVAPRTRELVAEARGRPDAPGPPPPAAAREPSAGQHLVDVHNALRAELERLRDLVEQVAQGTSDPAAVRSFLNRMAIRQNNWTLGTFCETYCRVITNHHTLEDQSIFPHLRREDSELAPVLDRLHAEHEQIAELLEHVDQALVALVAAQEDGIDGVRERIDELSEALLGHFSYEEEQLFAPLDRHGFY